MSDPRSRPEPVSGPVETGGFRSWSARSVGSDSGPEWQAWTWTSGRRGYSWLGILLVVLGVALLIGQVFPAVSFTSLLLLGLGIAFGAAWLIGGWNGGTLPALALVAWGGARLAVELGYLSGSGWTPLCVGLALIAAWGLGSVQKVRRGWALWVGGALAIFGIAGLSDALPGGWDLLWPLLLVGMGVLLIARRRTA
jgi:hypothetical protein